MAVGQNRFFNLVVLDFTFLYLLSVEVWTVCAGDGWSLWWWRQLSCSVEFWWSFPQSLPLSAVQSVQSAAVPGSDTAGQNAFMQLYIWISQDPWSPEEWAAHSHSTRHVFSPALLPHSSATVLELIGFTLAYVFNTSGSAALCICSGSLDHSQCSNSAKFSTEQTGSHIKKQQHNICFLFFFKKNILCWRQHKYPSSSSNPSVGNTSCSCVYNIYI